MSVALGAFAVIGRSAEADAFRVATGLPRGGGTLPLTFPMRWLADAGVRSAMAELLPEPGLVPVHESQTFDYVTPLRSDTPYTMRLTARRSAGPDQLMVEGTIEAADGARVATLETILRLFPRAAS